MRGEARGAIGGGGCHSGLAGREGEGRRPRPQQQAKAGSRLNYPHAALATPVIWGRLPRVKTTAALGQHRGNASFVLLFKEAVPHAWEELPGLELCTGRGRETSAPDKIKAFALDYRKNKWIEPVTFGMEQKS
ncbi:hypothetical protein Y1Q_0008371 [Alligator mississippiensis]|uniref:Uncharacterized protein n=1 Tax=Alligator mississippiensis TaxID=8496 RepID=A0A151N1U2_ALLMI|nr:hypothetical protein Y1Q_0008371 [Alligator mississippiensis]